jgi:putative phosphoesterase
MNIGIVSDTHGLIRQEVLDALRGSDMIIHAGDIGKAIVLESLEKIAPVLAIRGNVDRTGWAENLPFSRTVHVEGTRLFVIHDLKEMKVDPIAEGIRVVISGHTHIPSFDEEDEVIFLNPGSAGPRRFRLPVSLALIRAAHEAMEICFVRLEG